MHKARLRSLLPASAAAFLLVACSDPEAGEPVSEAPEPLALTFGPYAVQSGEEQDFCEYFELEGDAPTYVTRLHQENLGRTHHAFLYKTTLDTPPGKGPCPDAAQKLFESTPLYAATAGQAPSEMPEGVAMVLEAGQKMFLNIHLLNVTGEALSEEVTLTLDRGDPGRSWIPVGFFEFTTTDIHVPPHAEASAGNSCVFGADVSVVSITSHSHSRSTLVTANLWDGAGPGEEVYRSTSWAEPAVTFFEDPPAIRYDHGLTFTCNYENTDAYQVDFGDSADDEMCYLLGYYYPGPDTIICAL